MGRRSCSIETPARAFLGTNRLWLSGVMKNSVSVIGSTPEFTGAVIFGRSAPSIASDMGNVTMTYNAASCHVTRLGPDDCIRGVYRQQ
jgi:hypothetical protein